MKIYKKHKFKEKIVEKIKKCGIIKAENSCYARLSAFLICILTGYGI